MTLRRVFTAGWVVVLGAASLVLSGGCGDDAAGTPSGSISGGGPTIEQLPALIAKVLCDQQQTCLGAAYQTFLRGQDCVANATRSIEDGDIGASKRLVEEGKLTYDAAKAQACLDQFEALTCQTLTNPSPPACAEIFGGKGIAGSACTIGAECSADHFCKAGSACPGVCTPKAAEGAACAQDEECTPGLACAAGTCAKQVGAGASCDPKRQCEPGLLCGQDAPGEGAPATCKRTSELFSGAVGAPCEFATSKLCVATAACELQSIGAAGETTFACAARYASGAACKFTIPDGCPDDEYCPTDFTAKPPVLEGVCTKRPAPGAACGKSGTGATECLPGDNCVDGTCVRKQPLGSACTSSSGCYSGLCKAGVCAQGLACEPDRR